MSHPTLIRPSDPASIKQGAPGRHEQKAGLRALYVLARWQFAQTWRLLLVITSGVLLAAVLVCALPLYTQVSLTASLRQTMAANLQNRFLTVHARSLIFSTSEVQEVQSELSSMVTSRVGPVVQSQPALSIQMGPLTVSQTAQMQLIGTDVQAARTHVHVLAGRLPKASTGNTIEFTATEEGAKSLGLPLGQTLTLAYPVFDIFSGASAIRLNFRLVGIMAPLSGTDLFWHGENFDTESTLTSSLYAVLVSNTELMSVLNQYFSGPRSHIQFGSGEQPDIYWYYDFDLSHLDVNRLADLTGALSSFLDTASNNPVSAPYVEGTTATGPLGVLQDYSNRLAVLQLPILCLTLLIGGLALFFVLLMADLLVERHRGSITLLRSRGASERQVSGSLLGQSAAMSLLAFLLSPVLVVLLVVVLSMFTLSASDLGALNTLSMDLAENVQILLSRDLLVVGLALATIAFSIWRVMRLNILTARRESARATQQPLWMRYRLDLLAAVVALAGFGFSLYIASPGVLEVKTQVLILPLTSMLGLLALLLGCFLLFLRCFSFFLRIGERMAMRHRGAAPMLALAQMARSPRSSLRMTLLFALAVAFLLFTVMFSATQSQRLVDITTYQVGSDFSGGIPQDLQGDSWSQQQAFYRGIKGVTAVTLGDSATLVGGNQNVQIDLQAVDSSSYASTIYWTAQESDQSISALMKQLSLLHAQADKREVIPAILDEVAAQKLNVHVGQQFALADFHGPMSYLVTAIVHTIPTIYDTASPVSTTTPVSQGGMLVDFQTYSDVALAVNENGVSATLVWLRSQSSPAALQNVRQTLLVGTYALMSGLDRRALVASLTSDPMYRSLVGVLIVGSLEALLLSLVGNLLVSWLDVRERLTSFAVLRALGCEPAQIARVLIWEKGLVYGISLLLGMALSVLLALLILPAFVFSPLLSADSPDLFYIAQSVPTVQTVVPLWPVLGVLAGLVFICVMVVLLMMWLVRRPVASQQLRFNED